MVAAFSAFAFLRYPLPYPPTVHGLPQQLKPDVDPKTGTIDAPIELGGKPEYLASDGSGKVCINLEDKNQIAVVDIKARKVLAHWPVAPGGSGGDVDGHEEAAPVHWMPKSAEADRDERRRRQGARRSAGQAFASCRDGKLAVAGGNASGKFEIQQTVTTAVGAKTMDIDTVTHKAYLPTFEFEEQKPGATGRPQAKPGTFMIGVVAQR